MPDFDLMNEVVVISRSRQEADLSSMWRRLGALPAWVFHKETEEEKSVARIAGVYTVDALFRIRTCLLRNGLDIVTDRREIDRRKPSA